MKFLANSKTRIVVAILLPFAACAIQWQLWPIIKPFVWFLFFPTVFFSSRIGGKNVGFVSTVISALLVVFFFIPPQLTFRLANPDILYSVLLFLVMGGLFSLTHDSLEKAKSRAAAALEDSRVANEKVTQLYEKTLRLDELKTQFFANVSHELRTPLTLILGPVSSMLAATDSDIGFRRELEIVERNARLLYRQVSDLLDVAKLEAGGMTLTYVNTELSGIVRFVASHFENRAVEQEITFRVETPPEDVWAQVDTEKYSRILLNLLANAFKFTQSGGEIVVTLDALEGESILRIRDNGPGIPEEKWEMIFERFSQVDGGTERRYGGTGLGLAIVREFAGLHGGTAMAMEAPGGGALFTVTLPLLAPENVTVLDGNVVNEELFGQFVPAVEPLRSDCIGSICNSATASAPLILVVEDNPDMNGYISKMLGRHYRVASAFDGEEGFTLANSLKPDLLITDMMMPRMNGERLVQALRSKPEMNSLPIIMLSAKADDALRVHLLENGVQDYLTKPFSDAELLARVGVFMAERQRTTVELQKSEERFRELFTKAPVALCFVTSDGVIMDCNDRFERMFGYTHEDVPTLEQWWQQAYPDADYRTWVLDSWNAAVEKAALTRTDIEPIEYNITCKRGEVLTVQISGITLGDDLLATFFDVTEKRLAENELRKQKALLDRTSSLAKVGGWSFDVETMEGSWTEEVARIHDLDPSKPITATEGISYYHPESSPKIKMALDAVINHAIPYDLELKIITATGTEKWVRTQGQPVLMDGRVVQVEGTMQDITDRKMAEEELASLNANLERRVNDRTAELLAANRELDAFAYAVSHDLRAPLRAMIGFSQALTEDLGAELNGEVAESLNQITIASRHMGGLIDGLLSLSRTTRGELHRDHIDLSKLAELLRDELVRSDPERSVIWKIEQEIVVYADENMLEAVLRNLLGNAWKYTAGIVPGLIRLYTEQTVEGSRICVADNGAGFDMRHADRLFKPFQRLHRQDEFPGIGIGLATVQRIINRHGGQISAVAEPGNGATFSFTLPLNHISGEIQ